MDLISSISTVSVETLKVQKLNVLFSGFESVQHSSAWEGRFRPPGRMGESDALSLFSCRNINTAQASVRTLNTSSLPLNGFHNTMVVIIHSDSQITSPGDFYFKMPFVPNVCKECFLCKARSPHGGHSKYSVPGMVVFLSRPRSQEGHRRKGGLHCQKTLWELNTQTQSVCGAVIKP